MKGGILVALASFPGVLSAQSPELLWEIGSVDGAAHETFEYLIDGVILDEAIVVIAGSAVVRGYALDGTPLGEWSRVGQGPGELQSATHIRAYGDTIEVWDPMQRRSVAYSSDGAVLETVPAWQAEGAFTLVRPIWRRGRIGQLGQVIDAEPEDGFSFVVRIRETGGRDTLAVLPRKSVLYRLEGNPFRFPGPDGFGSGSGGGTTVLGDTLLVLLDGMGPEIRLLAPGPGGAREVDRWSLPGDPVPVTETQGDALVAATHARMQNHPRFVDFLPPDLWPPWTAIEDAGDGSVWLREGGPDRSAVLGGTERWVRWTLDGTRSTELELSVGEAVLAFSGDLILVRRVDELGVHYLHLYRSPSVNRRLGFLAALTLAAPACGPAEPPPDVSAETSRPPNIVVVLVDDLRWDEFWVAGHPYADRRSHRRSGRRGTRRASSERGPEHAR